MLKEGMDVYLPVLDNNGVDMVVKKPDGKFVEVQIKARSRDVKCPALFSDIRHRSPREGYWFVFYIAYFDTIIVLSSQEFYKLSAGTKQGKSEWSRQIRFDGKLEGKPCIRMKFHKYIVTDFSRILIED
jgi:hypothetical protein